jgi:hypothetical protein
MATMPRRIHVHLSVEDVGAPRTPALGHEPSVGLLHVVQAARHKFFLDGFAILEDDDHDIDIDYDGRWYIVEAWVV